MDLKDAIEGILEAEIEEDFQSIESCYSPEGTMIFFLKFSTPVDIDKVAGIVKMRFPTSIERLKEYVYYDNEDISTLSLILDEAKALQDI